MSEPRRPEPDARWSDQLRRRRQDLRERLRTRREIHDNAPILVDPDDPDRGPRRDGSLLWTALIIAGAAALVLGSVWAWESWSQRSDEPIDDLLPMLTVAADSDEPENAANKQDTVDARASGASPVPPTSTNDPDPDDPELVETVTPVPAIIVHISGAVEVPGVVRLPAGSRVFEAVELAGGATEDADVDRVNLAAPLVDGERIHVPVNGEDIVPALVQPDRPSSPTDESSAEPNQPQDSAAPVDLNIASVEELESLPGIGPATAEAIVRTREQRGPFLEVDELLEVPGIGPAKLAQLRPHVQVQARQ